MADKIESKKVGNAEIFLADCLHVLRGMPDNSVDSIVTDPPYGLSFMGKKWDYDVPSVEIWAECLRVLKPGGHLLAFAGTRTQHRMAVRIEDAGFEIRDMIAWIYGCLSEDSEVLTEDGWMPYNRAKQKNILTYDLQNDVYQWERPSRWNEYRVESDTAYRIQSDHTDQIVSRGHRCIVERGGMLEFVPADELAGVERVPYLRGDLSALPEGCGELLLQAVLREGEGLAQEAFSQRQGQEAAREGACWREKPGVEGRRDPLQAQGQVCGSGDQVRSLPGCVHEHGAEGWLCNGAPTSCCDGNRSSSDAPGVCASHQPRRDGQSPGEPDAVCEQCGSQTVRTRASYQTTLATVTAVEYSGLIWCPTVSTGAFVARRNGKVFITGNSGFPKSLDVSKAIDKAAGAERDVVGFKQGTSAAEESGIGGAAVGVRQIRVEVPITAPATDAARQWQGWGTALKPSLEPVTVARKPLIGTVAENVLAHGTGAINVDGCRVGAEARWNPSAGNKELWSRHTVTPISKHGEVDGRDCIGRWPANLIHDGSDEVLAGFPGGAQVKPARTARKGGNAIHGGGCSPDAKGYWPADPGGSAARFFQQCKGDYDKEWQDQNLTQSSADIAAQSLSLQSLLAVTVQNAAAIWPSLAGILSSEQTGRSTSATPSESSAISETAMQAMASIGSGCSQESQHERLTQSGSLVKTAAVLSPTGIMTITTILCRSDGNAEAVTFTITPTSLDRGGAASRFRYCAKASKRDRDEGLDGFEVKRTGGMQATADGSMLTGSGNERTTSRANVHPTVKPTDLMRYLCRLVTPPGGVVLDPFMGSGSTGKAAMREGFGFIGAEMNREYFEIAAARIENECKAGEGEGEK